MSNAPVPGDGRRRFLNGLLGGSFTAFAGAVLYPVLRFVLPPKSSEANAASVVAATIDELKPGSGKVFRFGNRPGVLVRLASGEFRAFSAVCPHLNCTVQYREDRSQIWCACHNGSFDLKGQVISGPPPRGLDPFDVEVRDGEVIVLRKSQMS
jgi:cytochrome b6-f complex iron-sulfur subunit